MLCDSTNKVAHTQRVWTNVHCTHRTERLRALYINRETMQRDESRRGRMEETRAEGERRANNKKRN